MEKWWMKNRITDGQCFRFCQNTTTGTISNNEGQFGLRLNNGGYDLIISYTGY